MINMVNNKDNGAAILVLEYLCLLMEIIQNPIEEFFWIYYTVNITSILSEEFPTK